MFEKNKKSNFNPIDVNNFVNSVPPIKMAPICFSRTLPSRRNVPSIEPDSGYDSSTRLHLKKDNSKNRASVVDYIQMIKEAKSSEKINNVNTHDTSPFRRYGSVSEGAKRPKSAMYCSSPEVSKTPKSALYSHSPEVSRRPKRNAPEVSKRPKSAIYFNSPEVSGRLKSSVSPEVERPKSTINLTKLEVNSYPNSMYSSSPQVDNRLASNIYLDSLSDSSSPYFRSQSLIPTEDSKGITPISTRAQSAHNLSPENNPFTLPRSKQRSRVHFDDEMYTSFEDIDEPRKTISAFNLSLTNLGEPSSNVCYSDIEK